MGAAVLPYAPLEQHALSWLRPRGHEPTTTSIATIFGVGRETVHRWRSDNRIGLDAADRLALELGRNLEEIWDEDAIEFAFVWASIDHRAARTLRARAQRESWALRLVPSLTVCVLGARS
jgi:hypothetical protein